MMGSRMVAQGGRVLVAEHRPEWAEVPFLKIYVSGEWVLLTEEEAAWLADKLKAWAGRESK